jgi:hypothetical protein
MLLVFVIVLRGSGFSLSEDFMSLSHIRLELARDHDFPEGSRERGYEFIAPLSDEGRILVPEWNVQRDRCRVRRFWSEEPDEIGHLIRKPGGSWAFHYDLHGDPEDEETGYRFGDHKFLLGDYVSIKEHDGALRTFQVVAIQPVP